MVVNSTFNIYMCASVSMGDVAVWFIACMKFHIWKTSLFFWSTVALQCCVTSYRTAQGSSHRHTYIPSCLDFLSIHGKDPLSFHGIKGEKLYCVVAFLWK